MVAIGRALMSNPSMLMCDELSLGLAPKIIREMYGHLATLKEEGTTLLIVEQDIHQALRFSDRYYCMQKGRVTLSGQSASASKDEIGRAYFGEQQ